MEIRRRALAGPGAKAGCIQTLAQIAKPYETTTAQAGELPHLRGFRFQCGVNGL